MDELEFFNLNSFLGFKNCDMKINVNFIAQRSVKVFWITIFNAFSK